MGLREQARPALAVALGAIVGGLVVGTFPPHPAWLWGLIGGLVGGGTGLLAVRLAVLPGRPALLRAVLAVAAVAVGFGFLFFAAGYGYVTNPRNWEIRPPG